MNMRRTNCNPWTGRWDHDMDNWYPNQDRYRTQNRGHLPQQYHKPMPRVNSYQPKFHGEDLPPYNYPRCKPSFPPMRRSFVNNDYNIRDEYNDNYLRNQRSRSVTPTRFSHVEEPKPWNRGRGPTPFSHGQYNVLERRSRTPTPFQEGNRHGWQRPRMDNKGYSDDQSRSKSSFNILDKNKALNRPEVPKVNKSGPTLIIPSYNSELEIGADGMEACVVFRCRYCNTMSLDKKTSENHLKTMYHYIKYKEAMMKGGLPMKN